EELEHPRLDVRGGVLARRRFGLALEDHAKLRSLVVTGKRFSWIPGFPKRYPWPCGQPRSLRRSACDCVSIPSATTVMPSARPRAITDSTTAVSRERSPSPSVNDLSILTTSIGNLVRCDSE